MGRILGAALLLSACNDGAMVLHRADAAPDDGGSVVVADAHPGDADAAGGSVGDDAGDVDAYPPMCRDALESSRLIASSDFGALDVEARRFTAGDCITHAGASLVLESPTGAQLSIVFPYSVVPGSEFGSRRVTGPIDTDAQLYFRSASGEETGGTTTIHVDVREWEEHPLTGHTIDATLTVEGGALAPSTVEIRGVFCEWNALLC
jgi:hypothetical protein